MARPVTPPALARPIRASGLRTRVIAACLLAALPPLVALAWLLDRQVRQALDQEVDRQLDGSLAELSAHLDRLRRQVGLEVRTFARDLEGRPQLPDANATAASLPDLPMLEILENDRVVFSRHWPASTNLPYLDRPLGIESALRVVPVGEGHGYRDRLAITADAPLQWQGRLLIARGGVFLDEGSVFQSLGPLGMMVGLYDSGRTSWWVAENSPLQSWTRPPLSKPRGEAVVDGAVVRYAVTSIAPNLWLVVAQSRNEVRALSLYLRRIALVLVAVAAVAAIILAVVVSAPVTRPLAQLGDAARRLALDEGVQTFMESGPREVRELQRAIVEVADELAVSRPRLLQAERVAAWREMARRLAHELKNPLFPIQVSIETLNRALDATEAGRAPSTDFLRLFRESSATILEELRILRGILDEFSRFARLPRPSLRPTAVAGIIEQVVALYRPQARATFDVDVAPDLPTVQADFDLLSRALGNLVANAVEASPEDAHITVRARSDVETVIIEVVDHGPGLTPEQRTRLFVPYFTTKPGGTGLGLAITQSIVADHGGHVDVDSEPGTGTTFRVVLPCAPRRGGRRREPAETVAASPPGIQGSQPPE
jgi:two-component system nitrogen regulation sensor histidine kinase NtrY